MKSHIEWTFLAAFDGIEEIMATVQETCAEVLALDTGKELDQVQRNIVTIQESVLELHRARQHGAVSDTDYEIKIASYGQQMDALQERQKKLKSTATRYAEVKYWLNTFKDHILSGESMDMNDAVLIRSLTDRIVVYDDRVEIHLRLGEIIEARY